MGGAAERGGEWDSLPELPLDVWGLVWGKLSIVQLSGVARVSEAWRCGAARHIDRKRAAAAALVMVPDGVPHSDQSLPQQIFRAVKRQLLGLSSFTEEQLIGGHANSPPLSRVVLVRQDSTCMTLYGRPSSLGHGPSQRVHEHVFRPSGHDLLWEDNYCCRVCGHTKLAVFDHGISCKPMPSPGEALVCL